MSQSDESTLHRYWDPKQKRDAVRVLPGGYYVSVNGELIVTTLGSCVAACIRDVVTGVGGLNHFMLPEGAVGGGAEREWGGVTTATRYGDFAMEALVNGILRLGAQRKNLEVKLFGGARILRQMTDIGETNINFARFFLETDQLKLVAEDVGGTPPRKVYFYTDTGRVRVKHIRRLHNTTLIDREKAYSETLKKSAVIGEVELF